MSDKHPAQRVIEAARKLADAGTVENDDEMVAAVRAYEASDDPVVVVSGDDLKALLDPYCERYFEVRSRVRAALEER